MDGRFGGKPGCNSWHVAILVCWVWGIQEHSRAHACTTSLVAGARATITSLWDQLLAGPETRAAAFPPFALDTEADPAALTEALFEEHEAYIAGAHGPFPRHGPACTSSPPSPSPPAAAATAELGSKAPLLKALEKRAALLDDKAEYEALIADPTRLLARGSSAACVRGSAHRCPHHGSLTPQAPPCAAAYVRRSWSGA